MTIPFFGILKKFLLDRSAPRAAAPNRARPMEKPSGERLSKTVLPNKMKPAPMVDPFSQQAGAAVPNTRMPSSPIRLSAHKRDLPPVVALALQPKVERAIALQLSDLLHEIPAGFLKPAEQFDPSRRILLKASEVEKGMSSEKPTVALATIYEQVPEIFLMQVPPGDATEVALPYQKVLAQFENLQVREDQEEDQDVPQVETPFLKTALEDTKRFGTKMQPLQTSAHPPVRVEPATAQALASAEPEEVARETANQGLKPKGVPLTPKFSAPPPPAPVTPASTASASPVSPARIPFNLPPNGAGASASERVPASSGPPVPTRPVTPPPAAPKIPAPVLSSVPKIPAPTIAAAPATPPAARTPAAGRPATPPPARIPFKVTPPSEELRPKFTLVPGTAEPSQPEHEDVPSGPRPASISIVPKPGAAPVVRPPAVTSPAAPAAKPEEVKISLSLRAIMSNLPAFQLTGSAESVPESVRIELPLALITTQLSSGRVGVPPAVLRDAVPADYHSLLASTDNETPVLLPLQEVLQHLPDTALQMRTDQEPAATLETIETPFSIKAAEDARRFSSATPAGQTLAQLEAEATKPAAEKPADAPLPTAAKPEARIPETPTVAPKAPKEPAATMKAEPAEKKPEPLKLTPAAEKNPVPEKKPVAAAEAKVETPATIPAPDQKKPQPPVEPVLQGVIPGEAVPVGQAEKTPAKAEDKNQAKLVVEKARALPGVAGCSVTFADGLSIAGNLPAEAEADGLCAMAPPLLQKIDRHMVGTKLGALTSMTLHCAKTPVTFFMKGNVCLTVLHQAGDLALETQNSLAEMTKELSHTYSQPEIAHVDH